MWYRIPVEALAESLLPYGTADLFRHAAFGVAESQYPHEYYLLKWILRLRFAPRRMTE
jgi:hypothetical protein